MQELKNKYQKIVSLIEQEEVRAFEDCKKELNLLERDLPDLNFLDVIKLCFKWKYGFEVSSNSKYIFIKEYLVDNSVNLYKSNFYDDFFKIFSLLFKTVNGKTDLDILKEEAYAVKKSEYYYATLTEFIDVINNNHAFKTKLPPIENFHIDILKILYNENLDERNFSERLNLMLEKKEEELIQLNQRKNIELFEKSKIIDDKSIELDNVYFDIKSLKNYNAMLLTEVSRKDITKVSQFGKTYWGDNYPALKVLFDFILDMEMIDFNWSCFANLMSVDNNDPFNISSKSSSQWDIGYFLYQLREFFDSEYGSTLPLYHAWLKKKIYIENQKVDTNYINKYVRGYKTGKKPLKIKKEIDDLCLDIYSKYKK